MRTALLFGITLFLAAFASGQSCNPTALDQECFAYSLNSQGACVKAPILGVCCNKICEAPENFASCALDCAPSPMDANRIFSDADATWLRANAYDLVFDLRSFGRRVLGAEIQAFIGSTRIPVYDDGAHNDANQLDARWAGRVTVPADFDQNALTMRLQVRYRWGDTVLDQNILLAIPVTRTLKAELEAPESIRPGSELSGRVSVKNGSRAFAQPARLKWNRGTTSVFETDVWMDANGTGTFAFPVSLIDPPGEYQLSISGRDSNGNELEAQKTVSVLAPTQNEWGVRFIGPAPDRTTRGTPLPLALEWFSQEGLIEGSAIELVDPAGTRVSFERSTPRRFTVVYVVPMNLPLGEQEMRLEARGFLDNTPVTRTLVFSVRVEPARIFAEWLEPQKVVFTQGDVLNLRLSLAYANGTAPEGLRGLAIIDNRQQELQSPAPGILQGTYALSKVEPGARTIGVQAVDGYGNELIAKKSIQVTPADPLLFWLAQNGLLAGAVLLAIIVGAAAFVYARHRAHGQKRLEEITQLEERLQQSYFEKNEIGKAEYDAQMDMLEKERKRLKTKWGKP